MNEPNYDALKFWLDVVQWLVTIAVAVSVWIGRGRGDNSRRIDDLERRVIIAEEGLRHAPDQDDIEHLRGELAQTNRALAELGGDLRGATALLNRLHEYLLTERGKQS